MHDDIELGPRQPGPSLCDDVLIRLIYAGALEPRPWLGLLKEIRRRLGCFHTNISFHRKSAPLGHVEAVLDTDADPAMLQEMYEKYAALDPVPYQELEPGRLYLKHDLFGAADVFYREYLCPVGLHEIAMLPISEPGGTRAWLTCGRDDHRPFTAAECRSLGAMSAHMSLALRTYAALASAATERDIYKEAVSGISIGTLLIDRGGHVIRIDAAAERILARQSDLSIDGGGRLRLRHQPGHAELQRIIGHAIEERMADGSPGFSRAMRISDHGHLGLLIRSIPPTASSTNERSAAAVLYISDMRSESTAPASKLMELFQLSATEAALAMQLARGRTLTDAAIVLNLSEQTARTYSKHIFSKTGTHRQAELVRLILTSVASLGP
jgi:DNA-binding CsgD family transcriptional regulator/PAS domain-containing protein